MVLHGLWDMSIFVNSTSGAQRPLLKHAGIPVCTAVAVTRSGDPCERARHRRTLSPSSSLTVRPCL